MARAFAAKGRDLALCARRTERLDELRAELLERDPGVTVAVAALDVNDHDQVPKVFGELSDELGGIDRIIVNAGIGKGAPLGSGKLWANKATIETNLVAALVQIETAIEMFKTAGGGHLVLISSVLANKGVPGVRAAYAAGGVTAVRLFLALLTALGRLRFGDAQALSSRYSSAALMFWAALIVIATIRLGRHAAHLRVADDPAQRILEGGLAQCRLVGTDLGVGRRRGEGCGGKNQEFAARGHLSVIR